MNEGNLGILKNLFGENVIGVINAIKADSVEIERIKNSEVKTKIEKEDISFIIELSNDYDPKVMEVVIAEMKRRLDIKGDISITSILSVSNEEIKKEILSYIDSKLGLEKNEIKANNIQKIDNNLSPETVASMEKYNENVNNEITAVNPVEISLPQEPVMPLPAFEPVTTGVNSNNLDTINYGSAVNPIEASLPQEPVMPLSPFEPVQPNATNEEIKNNQNYAIYTPENGEPIFNQPVPAYNNGNTQSNGPIRQK